VESSLFIKLFSASQNTLQQATAMTAVAKAMIVRGLVSALFSANLACFFQIWLCLKVGGYPTWHFGTRKKMTLSDIHSDTVSSPYPTFAIHPGMPRMRYS